MELLLRWFAHTWLHIDWYILVMPWALVICLIYTPSALEPAALGCIYQANHSCAWYNYYIIYIYIKPFQIAHLVF